MPESSRPPMTSPFLLIAGLTAVSRFLNLKPLPHSHVPSPAPLAPSAGGAPPPPPRPPRALGWDRPTPPSNSGQHFSASSYGHLGYTGTSLWCDPEKQLAIVLLTNRTWPDASNQAIKQIRPCFHDAIVEAL